MPNRCDNTLLISIPKELDLNTTLKELAAKLLNQDGQLSYSALIPQPADISDLPHTWPKEGDAELIAKYGVDNRYDWRIKNRGVKRDVRESVAGSLEDLYFTFSTPRVPPKEWFGKLCETFPNIGFTLEYREDGQQFCGSLVSDNEGGRGDFPDTYYYSCDECGEANDTVELHEELDQYICNQCASH